MDLSDSNRPSNTYPHLATSREAGYQSFQSVPPVQTYPRRLPRVIEEEDRPLLLRKNRELTPVEEDSDTHFLGRLDGLIG